MSSYHYQPRKRLRDQDVYDDGPLQQPSLDQGYNIDMHPSLGFPFSDNFLDISRFGGSNSIMRPRLSPLNRSGPILDPSRLDPLRFDPPRLDPSRLDPSRLDQPRLDQPRLDPSRLGQPRLDLSRLDQRRLDPSRLDPSRLGQPRLGQPRLDPPRLDQPRLDQRRLDQPRLDPSRLDPSRLDQPRLDPSRLDQPRLDPSRKRNLPLLDTPRRVDPPRPDSTPRVDPPRLVENRYSPPETEDRGRKLGCVTVYPPKVKKAPSIRGPNTASILRVGTLPRNTTEKHLKDLFSPYGRIKSIHHKPTSHFAYIQFEPGDQDGLVRAISELDRYLIKFGKVVSTQNSGSIQVQFASQSDIEIPKSAEPSSSSPEIIPYTQAQRSLKNLLKQEADFMRAALSLKSWFDQGHCTKNSANMFFAHLSFVNTSTRKAIESMKVLEQKLKSTLSNHKQKLASMKKESQVIIDIFHSACQKSWSHFSSSQQKLITKWSQSGDELLEKLNSSMDNISWVGDKQGVPAVKRIKVEQDTSEEVESLQKEIDQLREENYLAIQAKDQKMQLLNDVLVKFKEECPCKWEEITEGRQDILEEEENFDDYDLKIVEEVSLHESTPENDMNAENQDTEEEDQPTTSTASAQRPSTTTELKQFGGLSEPELSTVAVLAAFLAVHPLGASIDEITTYLRGFDHKYTSSYLESLLQRLTRVFQFCRVGGENMPQKWCFLGFQTCCVNGDKPKSTQYVAKLL